MLKAIIFDAYGTLISTGNGSVTAAKKILKLNGRNDISAVDFYVDWKKYHRIHMNAPDFITEEEIFHTDLNKLYKDYRLNRNADTDVNIMLDTLDKRTAFPESKEVLEKLSKEYIVCIGSNTDISPLLSNLKHNDLRVNRIFTSEELKAYKPNTAFYEKILHELAIDANEVLFVGDSPLDDVAGPKNAGIKTCLIDRNKTDPSTEITADFKISDLRELFGITAQINK